MFIALTALVGACSAVRCETATLRFGQIPSTVHAVSSLYLYIADQQGFFARENVAVEVVQIPGGTGNMVAALDRGEVDVTQTATPYLIQAVLNGSPAVAIAGTHRQPDLQPDRQAADQGLCRPQGQARRAVAADRHYLDFDAQALGAERAQ